MTERTFGERRRSADDYAEAMNQSGVRYFFAEYDGKLIGQIGTMDGEDGVYLRGVGILPEWCRRGLGRQLTMRMLQAEGHNAFLLDVQTANEDALSVYEASGFRRTEVYDFYEMRCV